MAHDRAAWAASQGYAEVQDCPDYYVSREGAVISYLPGRPPCQLTASAKPPSKYRVISLKKADGQRYTMLLHRVVAAAFIPNPRGLPVVNHLDGNPANCHVDNLEWCTYSANTVHARETGLITGISRGRAISKVNAATGKVIETYDSAIAAARAVGLTESKQLNKARDSSRAVRGFRWETPRRQCGDWRSTVDCDANRQILPGIYSVSSMGEVRCDKTGRILQPAIRSGGYPSVQLQCVDHSAHAFLIHRLVAAAFLGPPPGPHHEVNHKDKKRTNNHVANLEWVTRAENVTHAVGIPVVKLSETGDVIAIYPSKNAAGAANGVSGAAIGIAMRKHQRSAGYYWKKATESQVPAIIHPEAVQNAQPNTRAKGVPVAKVDAQGAIIAAYANHANAASAHGLTTPSVASAIKRGGTCAGSRWINISAERLLEWRAEQARLDPGNVGGSHAPSAEAPIPEHASESESADDDGSAKSPNAPYSDDDSAGPAT